MKSNNLLIGAGVIAGIGVLVYLTRKKSPIELIDIRWDDGVWGLSQWTFSRNTYHNFEVLVNNTTGSIIPNAWVFVGCDEVGNLAHCDIPIGESVISQSLCQWMEPNPMDMPVGSYDLVVAIWDAEYTEMFPRTKVGEMTIE